MKEFDTENLTQQEIWEVVNSLDEEEQKQIKRSSNSESVDDLNLTKQTSSQK